MKKNIICLILLFSLSGCSLVKYLCVKVEYWRYSYGEDGEFWYLQINDRESPRFYELANKHTEGPLAGGMKSWKNKSSEKEVLSDTPAPLEIKQFFDADGALYKEWYYEFYILVFKNGRLIEVKSTGKNPEKEYVWLETDYQK